MNKILSDKEVDDLLAGLSCNTYHKSCPFCKAPSQDTVITPLDCLYAVVCSKCGTIGPKGYTPEDAEALWNNRGEEA